MLDPVLVMLAMLGVGLSVFLAIGLVHERPMRRPICLWCSHEEHLNVCTELDLLDAVTCGCDPALRLRQALLAKRGPASYAAPLGIDQAAEAVWTAWYTAMCSQGRNREVAPERRSWASLPERERMLDRHIARLLAAEWGIDLEEAS